MAKDVKVTPRFKEKKPKYYFREWRKFRGWTQEELAERVGLTASSISQLETGKQGFTDDTLRSLALELGCSPGDLLMRNPLDQDSVWLLVEHLKKAPERQRQTAIRVVRELLRTGTDG